MRSIKSAAAAASAVVFASALSGCSIFSPDHRRIHTQIEYRAPTTPENVIHNIHAVYENLDFNKYDEVLASDYVFRFQHADIQSGEADSLIRAEEVTFAENLFNKGATLGTVSEPAASKISLKIDVLDSSPDLRVGHADWVRYEVQTTLLVTFAGSNVNVDSPATFYFKQEPAGSGTWKFAEWKDEAPNGAPLVAVSRD